MQLPQRTQPGPLVAVLLVCIAMILVSGCPWHRPPQPAAPVKLPPRALEPGEAVGVSFPADGMWHPSDYKVLSGQQLRMRPTGAATALPETALRFRVRRMTFVVRPDQPFSVTQPGVLAFKVDSKYVDQVQGPAKLVVERLK